MVRIQPSGDIFEAAAALMTSQGMRACAHAAHCALEARAGNDALGERAWTEVWEAIVALQTARRQTH